MGDAESTLAIAHRATGLSLPDVRIVVMRGPDRGRAVHLEREEIVIGTAPTADLRLTDPTVSRHHATLRANERGLLLTDLDSTNGTVLDRRRVHSAYVAPGDLIEVGGTRLRIEQPRGRVELTISSAAQFGPLIGRSVAARRLFALLEQVAQAEVTVLLLGESGVGKDLAAQALHEAGPRANGPFVVFDCGAAAASVIESELFGHERGAFTGAVDRRLGAFQEAAGGTLFLDEIGELPRELQPKLLRVIDRHEVRPLGADRTIAVDVRIVAATNRDLGREVNLGSFREDLFYRLSGFPVRVPPLRERIDDVPLLADHFWRVFTRDPDGAVPSSALPELAAHSWPGNVRELRHRVEQLALLRDPGAPAPVDGVISYREAKARALAAFEIAFLREAMARANGNVSEAARQVSMDRVYLSKLLRRHRT
ncbi:MAG: sigma 54-interacting transcriptional regulator [Deltaproteobacteria bacterium]|nr:sigma 54-interacting transcriptional regulator [Deltaproteobacteria bacterium]